MPNVVEVPGPKGPILLNLDRFMMAYRSQELGKTIVAFDDGEIDLSVPYETFKAKFIDPLTSPPAIIRHSASA